MATDGVDVTELMLLACWRLIISWGVRQRGQDKCVEGTQASFCFKSGVGFRRGIPSVEREIALCRVRRALDSALAVMDQS